MSVPAPVGSASKSHNIVL